MPVDTSIYANAVPQQPNPFALMGQVAQTQSAMNQNRLFGQEFAARQAVGQAYSNALDPSTGQVDVNKLVAGVASNPAAAFKAGEVGQQALQQQQGQTNLDASKVDLYNKHIDTVAQQLGPLMQKGAQGSLSLDDVYKTIGNLVSDPNSQITAQNIGPFLRQIPQGANGAPPTSDQLNQFVTGLALRNENGRAQIAAIKGSPMVINNGSGQQVVAPSPLMGTTTAISPVIPNQLSPGENAARIPTFIGGQPGTAPQSSLVDPTGHALGAQPAASGVSPLGTGRYPGQGTPAASGVAPAGPAGFVASGPKLGAAPAADVTATASANQGVNLQQTADSVPQRKALLGNLESAMNNFTTGPGADWTKVGKAFTNRFSPFGNVFDPKSIASQEEFAKQATQLAQSQFQALGGTGTDAKLDSAMHTSPNDALTPLGNKGIISMLKGNEDAINVKNREWQSYLKNGGSPADYGAFSAHFNTQFDPRVFQSVYMNPGQRQDLLKGLDPSEKSQFQQSYNYAVSRGWIPDPRVPANAPQ